MPIQYHSIDLNKVRNSTDYIVIFDKQLVIQEWNEAAATRFFVHRSDAIGKKMDELIDESDEDYRVQCYKESAELGKEFFFPSVSFLFTTGFYSQLILPLTVDSNVSYVVSIMREHTPDVSFERNHLLFPLLK
jgi:PAS domain-containing protein